MFSLRTAVISLSQLLKSNKVASSEASIPLISIDFAVVAFYACDSTSKNSDFLSNLAGIFFTRLTS